jgi:hypothetical protein
MVFYVWESIIGIVSLVPPDLPPPPPFLHLSPLESPRKKSHEVMVDDPYFIIHGSGSSISRFRILGLKMSPFVKKICKIVFDIWKKC